MIHDFIAWMGSLFSPEAYLFWTRIQCLLWTAADVLIIVFLTRSANLLRVVCGAPLHRVPFIILGVSLVPVPLVVLVPTGMQLFLVELLITVPHFLLILYVLLANIAHAPRGFAKLLEKKVPKSL
jgi:hypothetical protein